MRMQEHDVSSSPGSWGAALRGVPEYRPADDLDERGAVPAPVSVNVDIDPTHGGRSMIA